MTCSNGEFNPHPLANPFNTRLGYSNYSLNSARVSCGRMSFTRNPNASIPNTTMSFAPSDPSNGPSVPNQLPLREGFGHLPPWEIDPERFFVCPDGTVMDLRTRRVVASPANEPNRIIRREAGSEWNDNEIMSSPVPTWDDLKRGLTREDIAYARISQIKDAEIRKNLTDEQKRLLAAVDAGHFNSISKMKIVPDP